MPRVCRRLRQRKQYSAGDIYFLETGFQFLDAIVFDDSRKPTREEIVAAWAEIGGQILSDWIAEKPGSRPWAWWHLHPEYRRDRIDGRPHPFSDTARKARIEKTEREYPGSSADAMSLNFGKPRIWIVWDDFDAVYESEAAFLRRNNLLTPGEVAALEVTA